MEAAKSSKAKAGEEKSAAEGALADVSKDLPEDKVMLGDVQKDCAAYAEEYAAAAASRAEELAAVKKAKAIIEESTGGAAAIALPQTTAPSFLQVRRDRRSAHDSASAAAVRAVRELARRRKSPALAQLVSRLASAVRLGAAEGEDPFEKVKGLITNMIAKLEKDASEDAEQKAYCDKEMKDAEEKKAEKSDTVEKLTTKINQMAANSAKLKDSVATLEEELAELAETQVQMDKSLKDGIAGVEGALKILKDYYAKEDKAHDANDGAASGIIGMLEVCLSDFTKGLAEITAAEDSAQSEYEVTTQENKVAKAEDSAQSEYEVTTQENKV